MFMILNVAVLSLWIISLVALGRCYRRHTKEERAYENVAAPISDQLDDPKKFLNAIAYNEMKRQGMTD